MESLVNLKRNLRSVIPAYGFTPIGAGEGGNFCALVRGKEGKKDAQPFDGSARGSRNEYDLYTNKTFGHRDSIIYVIFLFFSLFLFLSFR